MATDNFRDNQEIPNLNLSDYEDPSVDSDSQFLSPDDFSFVDHNLGTPTQTELPSKFKPHFKNIPYIKTAELNDSLVSKMSNLNLTNRKERPDTLVIAKTTDIDGKIESIDSSNTKLNSVLQTTTDHPLKMLSPDIGYPDVVPKTVPSEKRDSGLSNGFTPQRNNSKSNLYVENFVTPVSQVIDAESNDILISAPDFIKVNAENFLNTEMVKKKVFNSTILCQNSSTPISNVIKQDFNISAIGNLVQNSNKSECKRNTSNVISQTEREESYQLPPQSPLTLSSPSPPERSKYQAIIEPGSCNVILKHRPGQDSALPHTSRRRIRIPEDNVSTDSGSDCSLELEEDSPELQETSSHTVAVQAAQSGYVPAQNGVCAGGECSGVRGDVSASNNGEKSTSTSSSSPIPEYSWAEEQYEVRSWLQVPVSSGERVECDMRVIEPFKRVLSHGGYTDTNGAIIVISACWLPHSVRPDYRYVMSHLFLYVMYTIEQLVTDTYVLVYVHGAASRGRVPSWHWLKESYKLIDRRLRKSMKRLYLVHPTFWLKSLVLLSKPFVSHKFYNKVTYVKNLRELLQRIPVEPNAIPDIVKDYDATLK